MNNIKVGISDLPENNPIINEHALDALCVFILKDEHLRSIFLDRFTVDNLKVELRNIIEHQMKDLQLYGLELKGKRLLNIGSGMPILDKYLSFAYRGIDIVAMDAFAEDENFKLHNDFVLAVSTHIPFPDNAFDLIISHAAIPHSYALRYDGETEDDFMLGISDLDFRRVSIAASFEEALRVVKPGGQIRLLTVGMSEDKYQNARYRIVKSEFDKFVASHPDIQSSYESKDEIGLIVINKPKDFLI